MSRKSSDSSASGDGANSEPGAPELSKAAVAAATQAALALCATCSHERGQHEGDRACLASWETTTYPYGEKGEKLVTKHTCACQEYWPIRDQREDGHRVTGYAVSVGGGVTLKLDRRTTTEFWDSLKAGRAVELTLRLEVASKGFKRDRKTGGLTELRKLAAYAVVFDEPEVDEETGEIR